MKFNTWIKGLAVAGIVSLASAAQADMTANPVVSAVADTTISGYVDASAQWNLGTGNDNLPPYAFSAGKADGFNLNVAQISVSKPLDESLWAAGYRVDLWMGPDAATLGTGSAGDFAIRQAYVQVRTPVGYGDLSWKLGVFDTIVGYESLTGPANPHYTRSYGFTIEPTTHTGLLGTYQVSEYVGLSAGVANTAGPYINQKAYGGGTTVYTAGNKAESSKACMGAVSLSAPETWSFMKGSSLYFGIVSGFDHVTSTTTDTGTGDVTTYSGGNQINYYVGTTLATPVTGLQFGLAYDNLDIRNGQDYAAIAFYGQMQVTEKTLFLTRVDALRQIGNNSGNIYALTMTIQYDLWQNVLSRVEFRWDHAEHGLMFGGDNTGTGAPTRANAFMLAANLIYAF